MSTTKTPEIHRATRANGKQAMFESVHCTRCGGNGRFGPLSVNGGRCFKCNGSGVNLTKRGQAAMQRFTELLSKRTVDLEPGDKILDYGAPGIIAGGWRTVKNVERQADRLARDPKAGGQILTIDQIDQIDKAISEGETAVPTTYRDKPAMVVSRGYVIECEGYSASGKSADDLHRVASSGEQKIAARDAAREYELTLTKTGKPRKRR